MAADVRTALLIAAATAILYLPRLGSAPMYLAPDEVFIGLHANALATTGRDYGGRWLPLYIEYEYLVTDPTGQRPIRHGWLPPIIYYAIALALLVAPLSEAAIRFPTVVVGIVNVVLMYFIGRRLFRSEPLAILCAALLALTPAHFIHSRFAMDYLYPVPFVLAWLLGLLTYLSQNATTAKSGRALFLATFALGVGLFSYIAAGIVMPLYLVVTFAALAWARQSLRAYALAALGFLAPAALHVPWTFAHRTAITDILSKYGLDDSNARSIARSVRGLLTFHNIGDQISRLWTFFDPRFLFFDGPMELMFSTRAVGVFLVPIAVLVVFGLRAVFRGSMTVERLVLLLGLVVGPLAASLVRTPDAIYRALELLPFVIFLAVEGVRDLWSVRFGRIAAIGLLAIVPLQFGSFYADYFGDYQKRASLVFSGNIRGALEEAIAEAQHGRAPTIYLGRIGPYGKGGLYWNFYLAKHRATDLASHTVDVGAFDADRVQALEPGSVIVNNAGEGQSEPAIDRLVAGGQLSRKVIKEPDGTPTFFVLTRVRAS
jgi:Dolichyl-phosphate-mannose-protein mannosyltransferase